METRHAELVQHLEEARALRTAAKDGRNNGTSDAFWTDFNARSQGVPCQPLNRAQDPTRYFTSAMELLFYLVVCTICFLSESQLSGRRLAGL